MIQTNTIGSFTEICGGGNYLTESYPTNFHTFCKRKVLVGNDNVDNYREVTEAEKTAIEAQDSSYVRPPQYFIDLWEGVGKLRHYYVPTEYLPRFNESTGFFELNGIKDIDYEEALLIYTVYTSPPVMFKSGTSDAGSFQTSKVLRTMFALYAESPANLRWGMNLIEVVVFSHYYSDGVRVSNMRGAFNSGTKRVLTPLNVENLTTSSTEGFYQFGEKLEYILLKKVKINCPFKNAPNLEIGCVQYLIENAANTQPITVTLHPNVFAQVTDELFDLALSKNISIATV